MIIKQEETLEWIEQMQAAMLVVVDQCGDFRRQLPSARELPPPPKVDIPQNTAPSKPPLVKRFSLSTTKNLPVTNNNLKPLPKTEEAVSSAPSSKPPLPDIKDAQKILSAWKDGQEKSNEMNIAMNEVLLSMREMRLAPQLGEATRQLPPSPQVAEVALKTQKAPKKASYQTSTVSSTHNRKLTCASPAKTKPNMTKTPLRRFSKDLDDRGKSPGRVSKSPSLSRPDIKSRISSSKSPSTSRPSINKSSYMQSTTSSKSRVDAKSPLKSRASELAASRMPSKHASSSSSKLSPKLGKPPLDPARNSSTPSKLRSASKVTKEVDVPKKKPTPSSSSGSGLKAMMAKNRQQKSVQEDDIEIFVSPQTKKGPNKEENDGFSYTPPAPTPTLPNKLSPRATSTPKNEKEEIFDTCRYFTAAARVVVRNGDAASADEVGELGKGDVVKCDMAKGDWLRLVGMVGWHDPDRTLEESGAWVLSRNKVKEMMIPASEEDASQVEATFNDQQEKKISAATPKKGGGAKSPLPLKAPTPNTTTPKMKATGGGGGGGDEVFDGVKYFTSASNSLIRNGAQASADEVGQLKKGDIVCCDKRCGDWLRVTNMFGLVDPDPKKNTLAQTGAWVLSRNKVKEMMIPASEEDASQVEATFNDQQEKKISAATPKKGGGAKSTQPAAFTPPPKAVSAVAVKNEKYPKYFKTMNKCTVRLEPDSGGDELCELSAGRIIKCLSGTGDWARATSLEEVNKAIAIGMIPSDMTYEFNSEVGVDDSKKKGMWLLIRNKKREMLMEIDENEGVDLWVTQGGVDLYGNTTTIGNNLNQDMEDEASSIPEVVEPEVEEEEEEVEEEEEESTGLWYEVTSKGKLSIRSKPTGDGEELGILRTGDQVATIKQRGDWFFVKFPFEESALISGGATNTIHSVAGDTEGGHHVLKGWVLSKLVKRDVDLFKLLSSKVQTVNNKKYSYLFGNVNDDKGDDEEDDEEEEDTESMGLTEYEMLAKMRRESTADDDSFTSKSGSSKNKPSSDWPKFFVIMTGPLHLHSNPGVGGRIVQEVNNGEMIKAIGERASWLEIELRNGRVKSTKTAFLSKSKSSSRSIIQAADNGEAEKQWLDQ